MHIPPIHIIDAENALYNAFPVVLLPKEINHHYKYGKRQPDTKQFVGNKSFQTFFLERFIQTVSRQYKKYRYAGTAEWCEDIGAKTAGTVLYHNHKDCYAPVCVGYFDFVDFTPPCLLIFVYLLRLR